MTRYTVAFTFLIKKIKKPLFDQVPRLENGAKIFAKKSLIELFFSRSV